MSDTMQLIATDSTAITINRPAYGYECEIHMPIVTQEKHPQGYAEPFDMDSAGGFDYRVLSTAKLQLPYAQKLALNGFLRDQALGRCENFTLSLGSDPTGFFPFMPDLGDVGYFTVRLLSQNQGGMLLSPYKYWQDDISLALVSAPSYTPAAGADQGPFQIGTVDGLLYPQNTFNPVSKYNHRTSLSRSGVPSSIDGRTVSDSWESSWDQQCNTGKAAELIKFLIGATGRGAYIQLYGQSNYFIYGADNGDYENYVSKFLGSSRTGKEIVIKAVCEGFNRWTIPLSFWLNNTQTPEGYILDDTDTGFVLDDIDTEVVLQS